VRPPLAPQVLRAASLAAFGQRTSYTQPAFSHVRMIPALMSI
jgi:hypothetical protein